MLEFARRQNSVRIVYRAPMDEEAEEYDIYGKLEKYRVWRDKEYPFDFTIFCKFRGGESLTVWGLLDWSKHWYGLRGVSENGYPAHFIVCFRSPLHWGGRDYFMSGNEHRKIMTKEMEEYMKRK